MSDTPSDSFSRSEPKSTRSSPTPGRPPPWISWKIAGKMSAASASISMADWALAAVWLNVCLSRRPPTSMAAPITSRMLPITEPTIEAFTTSCKAFQQRGRRR